MVEQLLDMVREGTEPNRSMTTLDKSLESHYIALAAEQSRISGGKLILLEDIR